MKHFVCLILSMIAMAFAVPARATESIVTDGVVNAPVSAVWSAWATSAALKTLLAPHATTDRTWGRPAMASTTPSVGAPSSATRAPHLRSEVFSLVGRPEGGKTSVNSAMYGLKV